MDIEQFKQEAEKIKQSLSALRVAERNAVIPFMNGDFTQWDLYLASSSEYAMRLIDGFISMLESRNLVCVAQLLRAQVGVCLRTFALFAAEDQDDFLKKFDPKVKDVYKVTSGFVHFSTDILSSIGVPGEGYEVEFNFGAEPNERNNVPLVEYGKAFCHYVDLHLQMLHKVIASDEWYADRFRIDSDGPADEASTSEKV